MSDAAVSFPPLMDPRWTWRAGAWQGVQREPDPPGRIVTPFHHLQRRAEQIAKGALVSHRRRMQGEDWIEPHREHPGELRLEAHLAPEAGLISWTIFWQEAGDPDSHGLASGYGAPDEALARMIETCEEYDRQQREGLVEFTGGTA